MSGAEYVDQPKATPGSDFSRRHLVDYLDPSWSPAQLEAWARGRRTAELDFLWWADNGGVDLKTELGMANQYQADLRTELLELAAAVCSGAARSDLVKLARVVQDRHGPRTPPDVSRD